MDNELYTVLFTVSYIVSYPIVYCVILFPSDVSYIV